MKKKKRFLGLAPRPGDAKGPQASGDPGGARPRSPPRGLLGGADAADPAGGGRGRRGWRGRRGRPAGPLEHRAENRHLGQDVAADPGLSGDSGGRAEARRHHGAGIVTEALKSQRS